MDELTRSVWRSLNSRWVSRGRRLSGTVVVWRSVRCPCRPSISACVPDIIHITTITITITIIIILMYDNNNEISIMLFRNCPTALTRSSDVWSTKQFSFEAVLDKTSVTDMMEMVWKTVPCSGSSVREAMVSERVLHQHWPIICQQPLQHWGEVTNGRSFIPVQHLTSVKVWEIYSIEPSVLSFPLPLACHVFTLDYAQIPPLLCPCEDANKRLTLRLVFFPCYLHKEIALLLLDYDLQLLSSASNQNKTFYIEFSSSS